MTVGISFPEEAWGEPWQALNLSKENRYHSDSRPIFFSVAHVPYTTWEEMKEHDMRENSSALKEISPLWYYIENIFTLL